MTSLQVTLAETSRVGGKVRQTHVASLGSVPVPMSAADRVTFWTKLHERLSRLGNRIDPRAGGAILNAIHARIPMPLPADQELLRLENAREDAKQWANLDEMQKEALAAHKALAASLAVTIARMEKDAATFNSKATAAEERLAKVERGEDVTVGTPMTYEQMIEALGLKPADLRHMRRIVEIYELGGPSAEAELIQERMKGRKSAEHAQSRTFLAELRRRAVSSA